MTYFTSEQVNLLLKPIHPRRVLQRDGMSYVEGYDIKAELNRVFGFGRWDTEILDQSLICETAKKMGNGRDGWYVAYRTMLRLTIKAPDGTPVCRHDESHVGESTHPVQGEAHGNALTNSWTYALKRCATNLGDQFGLSLYNKGSREALVRWTLVRPEDGADKATVDDNDVPQVTAETEPEPGTEDAAEALEGTVIPPQQPTADDPVFGAWAPKLDEITSVEDAERVLAELDRDAKGGLISNLHAAKIRGAIKDKATLVAGNGHKPQTARPQHPKGPPAEERGAVAVPTGKGDDGDWVQGFLKRLDAETDPDKLRDYQQQVGNAVKAKTITPGKSVDLTAAIRNHRNKLQGAAA